MKHIFGFAVIGLLSFFGVISKTIAVILFVGFIIAEYFNAQQEKMDKLMDKIDELKSKNDGDYEL